MAAEQPLRVELVPYRDDIVWLRFKGRVEMSTSPAFRRQLERSVPSAEEALILEMQQVRYMDSSGVAVLVETLQWCREAEVDLILYTPNRAVCEGIEVVGLGEVFTVIGRYGEIEEEYGPAQRGDETDDDSSASSRRRKARSSRRLRSLPTGSLPNE